MRMLRRNSSLMTMVLAVWAMIHPLGCSLAAQSLPAQTWQLPQGNAVKDSGQRVYRFTVDYNTANSRGEIVHRQRITGDYTRGLANQDVMWSNVSEADAEGLTSPFGAAQKQNFMEGFRYRNDLGSTMKPDFFKGFPATAVVERNLAWDTGMIEHFGQDYFDRLKLNTPYHPAMDQAVKMPEVGTFHNRDIVLEWIGVSRRNGSDCAVIRYEAFFNPVQIVNGGFTMNGRSDYWGDIWVSLVARQIEYATLNENVMGEAKPAGQERAQNVSVFRSGVLELLGTK